MVEGRGTEGNLGGSMRYTLGRIEAISPILS
jgi:hypothetical protein